MRALNPWPGTWLEIAGERIKVLAAELGRGRRGGAGQPCSTSGSPIACGRAGCAR